MTGGFQGSLWAGWGGVPHFSPSLDKEPELALAWDWESREGQGEGERHRSPSFLHQAQTNEASLLGPPQNRHLTGAQVGVCSQLF